MSLPISPMLRSGASGLIGSRFSTSDLSSLHTQPHRRTSLFRYGTRLNGKALTAAAAVVQPGDTLAIGASTFKLQAVASN